MCYLNEIIAIYGNTRKYAVALITLYPNDWARHAQELIGTKVILGVVDDCWLICSDSERYRLDTEGVHILGNILPADAQTVNEIIEKHGCKERELRMQRKIVANKIHEVAENSNIVPYDITIKDFQALNDQYHELTRELSILYADFNVSLGAYYIDKAA